MDRKTRKLLKNLFRTGDFRHRAPHINVSVKRNAWARHALDLHSRDGQIGVIASGMDCDCTQYHHEFVMPAPTSVAAFLKWIDEHSDCLDGPETLVFAPPPDIVPQFRSRDLALMAYEDGHPSTVYPVGYDELMEA